MPELMEHESIDDVASRAVAAARREVSARSLPELHLRAPRPWFTPVVALAAVAVVVVGLIGIGTNRDPSAGSEPPSLRWLLRELPAGWRPTRVFDSTLEPSAQPADPFVGNLYATDAEPLGPFLTVQGTTDTTQSITIGSYSGEVLSYEEFELDGQRAAFATLPNGARGLYVEINSAWVYLSSRGLSDDVLRGLARTLTPDVTGHYDVAASALPEGMRKIPSFNDQPRDFASSDYSPANGTGGLLELSVGRDTGALTGIGLAGYDFKEISEDGFSGFLGGLASDDASPSTTTWMVLWRRDGLQFWLSGHGVSSDQIVNAAATASQASPDEWADLLGSEIQGPDDTAPTGTAPVEATDDTMPSFDGEPRDVAITVRVDDVSDNEQQWSGSLPTGESWTAKISRVYDRIDVRYSIDGNIVETSYGTSTAFAEDNQVTCCNPMAMTKNPNAVSLRVLRANGDRYTIPLRELPGTDGVRIALIAIPDGTLLAELIDATGNVVESYAPH